MRVVLQIVTEASVELEGKIISSIGKGYCLLVGFAEGDDDLVAEKMAEKIAKLRIFPDENGKTNLSLSAVNGEILSVSQFTLNASAKEGNRPSFTYCMNQVEASRLYEVFLKKMRTLIPSVQSNVFHTDCKIHLVNDGPFTLILDSKELFK